MAIFEVMQRNVLLKCLTSIGKCMFLYVGWVFAFFVLPDCSAQEREMRITSKYFADTVVVHELIHLGEQIWERHPEEAISYVDSAYRLSEENGYRYGRARAMVLRSRILLHQKRYRDSRSVLELARADIHAVASVYPELTVWWYSTLGGVSAVMGNNDSAVYRLFLALKEYDVYGLTNKKLLGGIYANIGAAMLGVRQLEPSMFFGKRALQLARQINDTNMLAVAYSNLASCYRVLGKPDSSILYRSNAVALYLAQNKLSEAQRALSDIAGVWIQEGDFNQAAALLDSAARLYPEGVSKNTAMQQRWGRLNYLRGNYQQALFYYRKALALNNEEGGRVLNLSVYSNLADIHAALGQYQEAYEARTAFAKLVSEMYDERLASSTNELQTKYRTLEQNQKLMAQQLQLAIQQTQLQRKNIWLGAVIFCSFLMVVSVWYVYYTRQKLHREKVKQEERSRIARDLHDGMGALLSAIKMNYTLLGKQGNQTQTETFQDGISLINEMRDELRATAYNLMPDSIVRQNLGDAVHTLCNRMQKGNDGIQIEVQTYGDLTILDNELYFSAYRMIEELINNSLKHAHATEVFVQLMLHDERLHITVEDNGIGFDANQLANNNGMGLQILKQRVRQIHGAIHINTQPGMGACVELEIPYQNAKKSINIRK